MNSPDPWRVIVTDPFGGVILPRPQWGGHPFYREVPSWTPAPSGESRVLFDGTFVSGWVDSTGANMNNDILGAELTALSLPGLPYGPFFRPYYGYGYPRVYLGGTEPPQRTGLTKDLAPIVAPATGGVLVEKRLDDKQVLHVRICVDGKCYTTSMNLAPAIAMVMQKLARWHDGMHAPKPAPETVVKTVETAVGMAEDAIVGALISKHIDTISAGILGDIAGAVKGAVTGVASGVASTFKKFKGPIGAAAGIAAASAAALIPGVGPIAAPIAGKLANDLVQSAAGDNKAKQAVAQAQQQAKTDPTVALALQEATKAVANSTAAHHVKDTATKAARGDRASRQQIAQVATDAEQGDPAAKAVADLVANAMKSEWGANLWERATGRGPGTISGQWVDLVGADWVNIATVGQWQEIVGAALEDIRDVARTHASTKQGKAAGVIQYADGTLHGRGFGSLERAMEWLKHATRNRTIFIYAAACEKDRDGSARIHDEEVGEARPRPVTSNAPVAMVG